MVISISPQGRDSFNDISTLNIDYKNGRFRTPMRIVNRHDLNAKDKIGANIPLTQNSHSLLIQEWINPSTLDSILNTNGYLRTMAYRLRKYVDRVKTPNPLVFLYPTLTNDSIELIDNNIRDFATFCCDLANELGLESILLPIVKDAKEIKDICNRKNVQLIPILNLKEHDFSSFKKKYYDIRNSDPQDIPIIGFRFYSFPSANLAYNLIMDDFEKIHENNQATMLVDVDRLLPGNPSNISAPHYGPFFIADLVAERYAGGGPRNEEDSENNRPVKPVKPVKLFCKDDLVTSTIEQSLIDSGRFNIKEEAKLFSNDKQLQELFYRVVNNQTDAGDWKDNRPMYISRVHENMRTRPEMSSLQKNIDSNTASDYLQDKYLMNETVLQHMKLRKTS
ncbi:MAG: hypothetical protein KC483_09085 [Nitrosarchaeum sp.]|nr:hypothetical protein [Nitrosarchaeum sp.]MCA9820663.1 hypothetical protein [Nitrosarchaeum sp.]